MHYQTSLNYANSTWGRVNLIIAILCHFVSFHLLPWYHLKIVQHQKFIKGVVLADVTKAQHFFVGGLRHCSSTTKIYKKGTIWRILTVCLKSLKSTLLKYSIYYCSHPLQLSGIFCYYFSHFGSTMPWYDS